MTFNNFVTSDVTKFCDIVGNRLYCANVGDSRTLLCRYRGPLISNQTNCVRVYLPAYLSMRVWGVDDHLIIHVSSELSTSSILPFTSSSLSSISFSIPSNCLLCLLIFPLPIVFYSILYILLALHVPRSSLCIPLPPFRVLHPYLTCPPSSLAISLPLVTSSFLTTLAETLNPSRCHSTTHPRDFMRLKELERLAGLL